MTVALLPPQNPRHQIVMDFLDLFDGERVAKYGDLFQRAMESPKLGPRRFKRHYRMLHGMGVIQMVTGGTELFIEIIPDRLETVCGTKWEPKAPPEAPKPKTKRTRKPKVKA